MRGSGQRKPGAAAFVDGYLAFLLAKTSHLVSAGFHARLRELGVSIPTWRILAVLQGGARPVGELAGLVLLNQPTLSKALDRLEAEGLVGRGRDAGNRRSVKVKLLPRGRVLVAKLVPLANRHEAEVFAHLGAARRRALASALQATVARLSAAEGEQA